MVRYLKSRLTRLLLMSLALVAVGCVMLPSAVRNWLEPTAEAATLTVTTTADDGAGSLRQAIITSNQNAGPSANVINFNIPGAGVKTINLLSPLPTITASVTIDGFTQPGSGNGGLLIELNGASAGAVAGGLTITAGHCNIYSLVINRFSGSGIAISNQGGNVVSGNRIGTNPAGTVDSGNARHGIEIDNSGGNNIRNNYIAGNDASGISISGASATGNNVLGNIIGINTSTATPLGNQTGIQITNGANGNAIGPSSYNSSDVNSIGGNTGDGILIETNNNTVVNNYIGTMGAGAIANGHDGILIRGGASNTIGGTNYFAINIISANHANGIEINGAGATGNLIQTNFIGSNGPPNQTPLGNTGNGILITNSASNNQIGGTNTFNSQQLNFIDHNGGDGVRVDGGNGNRIEGNYIHDNTGAGIYINTPASAASGTSMTGNRIFNDGALGIDLAPAGVTQNDSNDADAGANGLQNFPVLTAARISQGRAFVTGTLNSRPNATFRLDFFASDACDSSGNGEADSFIGFTTITTGADGNASFNFTSGNGSGGASVGQFITATATDAVGNTSEFSQCLISQSAGFFTFSLDNVSVNETAGSVTVTVYRAGGASGDASIEYATGDITARAGSDYTAVSGTLNFADGERQKTITIPIINDTQAEGLEVFSINISNPFGAGLGSPVLPIVIDDDETPSRTIYAVTTANELLSFNPAQGGPTPLSSVYLNGEKILAIDFRPLTGQLYGLGLSGHLYTINKTTGALSQVGTNTISGLYDVPDSVDIDFNPVTDRLRVVLRDGRNLQLNPDTGAVTATDGALAFAQGDTNFGLTPQVFALAHLNNFAGATSTTTYALNWTGYFDSTQLVTLGSVNSFPVSPASGQLFTVGRTGEATADYAGFDISDTGEAFAALAHPEEGNERMGLFKINLATGSATRLNIIGSPGRVPRDIAFEPGQRLQFRAPVTSVNEDAGTATVTVVRTGGSNGAVSVNYATSNGTATAGSDYTTASGTLNFADGETSKTFNVSLIDDATIERVEFVTLTLSNATGGAVVGPRATARLAIMDEPTEPGTNPIDNADNFVRQHYRDFLSRTPDAGGLEYWTNQITQCGADAACIHERRVATSAAFYIANEFQETGFFVYRIYKAAYGARPTFVAFTPDRARIVAGANLEAGKQSLLTDFVGRPEFIARYPLNQSGPEFVDALIATAMQGSGVQDLPRHRNDLITLYNSGTSQTASRAAVLHLLADDEAFTSAEYTRAFVLMQYFGYLQREPDQNGYDFWLNVLNNRQPGNYRGMVCAFITSAEYQRRFGSIITRSNSDCAQ